MANFILNTSATRAVRKSEVVLVQITERNAEFQLWIWVSQSGHREILFETADTLEAIQALGATIIAELEA